MQSPLQNARLECFVWRIVIRIKDRTQQYESKYERFNIFPYFNVLCNGVTEMQEIEYRGYIIKRDSNNVRVYDKKGNFLKQTAFSSKGSVTDMKVYIDNLIKRYGQ